MEECKEKGHAAIPCGKFFVSGPVGGGSLETGDDFTRRGVEELDSCGQTICDGRGFFDMAERRYSCAIGVASELRRTEAIG